MTKQLCWTLRPLYHCRTIVQLEKANRVLLTSLDISWHLLTSLDISWHLLTSLDLNPADLIVIYWFWYLLQYWFVSGSKVLSAPALVRIHMIHRLISHPFGRSCFGTLVVTRGTSACPVQPCCIRIIYFSLMRSLFDKRIFFRNADNASELGCVLPTAAWAFSSHLSLEPRLICGVSSLCRKGHANLHL